MPSKAACVRALAATSSSEGRQSIALRPRLARDDLQSVSHHRHHQRTQCVLADIRTPERTSRLFKLNSAIFLSVVSGMRR